MRDLRERLVAKLPGGNLTRDDLYSLEIVCADWLNNLPSNLALSDLGKVFVLRDAIQSAKNEMDNAITYQHDRLASLSESLSVPIKSVVEAVAKRPDVFLERVGELAKAWKHV